LGRHFPAGTVDCVLLTHYHMDHVQGLFPIRWGQNHQLRVIGPDDPLGCDDLFKHPGILNFDQKAVPFAQFQLMDVSIVPLPLQHSRPTLGYVIQYGQTTLAYLSDTYGLPGESTTWLSERDIDLAVIDCSYPPTTSKHLNHNDLDAALGIVERIRPQRALLTHISHLLDDWFIEHPEVLPNNVTLAWDGLTVQI
jgi:phosphoribosyl 1,2-cyclic phosphate phosphodiesterase